MIRETPEQMAEMQDLCRTWGPRIELLDGEPNGVCLLYALFMNERYNTHNAVPRYEKGYGPGGRYFNQALWDKWSEDSAKSFSNWQIMYLVAVELGYQGPPNLLDIDGVAVEWVVRLIKKRLARLSRKDDGLATLEEILDAYNTGNPRDANIPHKYIERGIEHYAQAKEVFE